MKRALSAVFAVAGILAAQSADKVKAEAMVKDAGAFLKANGKEKFLKEVNFGTGKFHAASDKALYILVYDLEGVCVAHGFNGKQIGMNRFAVKDPDGKLYIQEMIKAAKAKGKGWVDYKYTNPTTNKVEPKTTYFELVEGWVLGCGIYK